MFLLINLKAPTAGEVKVNQALSDLASNLRNLKCKSSQRPVAGNMQTRRGGGTGQGCADQRILMILSSCSDPTVPLQVGKTIGGRCGQAIKP